MSIRTHAPKLLGALLVALLAGCTTQQSARISYQHLATVTDAERGDKTLMQDKPKYQVFLLRGITNTYRSDKINFNFLLGKVVTPDGSSTLSGQTAGFMKQDANFLAPNLMQTVGRNQTFAPPTEAGRLFIIGVDGTEEGSRPILRYKPATGEWVEMERLDPNATPLYGNLDPALMEQIHAARTRYETMYDPDGNRAKP